MIKGGKFKYKVFSFLMTVAVFLTVNPRVVFGAEDPSVGTANDDIENMIEVGKSLIGQTPYVYGGGHSDWDTQRELDVPTGLDNSSFVAWVMYRGMGVDMGYAPTSGNFEAFYETVNEGTLEGVQRGDLIADERHIEIYLGQDEEGKHLSLVATNERTNVSIQETNWGRGIATKTIIRPNIEEAKKGVNGLSHNDLVVIDALGERALGGDQIVKEDASGAVGENSTLPDGSDVGEPTYTGSDDDDESFEQDRDSLFMWLDPIVDFRGASNTHSASQSTGKQLDGGSKGLKGHQQNMFEGIFGGF